MNVVLEAYFNEFEVYNIQYTYIQLQAFLVHTNPEFIYNIYI